MRRKSARTRTTRHLKQGNPGRFVPRSSRRSAEEAHFRCSVTCGDQGVLQLPVYVSGRANTDEDIGWIKRDLNYRIGSCVKPVVYSMVGLRYRQPKPKISVEGNVTLQNLEAT